MVFLSGTIFIYKFRYNLLYFPTVTLYMSDIYEIIILHTIWKNRGICIDNIGLVIYTKDGSTEDQAYVSRGCLFVNNPPLRLTL